MYTWLSILARLPNSGSVCQCKVSFSPTVQCQGELLSSVRCVVCKYNYMHPTGYSAVRRQVALYCTVVATAALYGLLTLILCPKIILCGVGRPTAGTGDRGLFYKLDASVDRCIGVYWT